MADDLVIRKPALYRYAVRLLVDVLYQMGCDMRQTFRVNDTDIHAWNHFTERYTSATEDFTRRFILFQLQCRYGIKFAFKRRINGLYTVQRATDGRCHRADSVRITAQVSA